MTRTIRNLTRPGQAPLPGDVLEAWLFEFPKERHVALTRSQARRVRDRHGIEPARCELVIRERPPNGVSLLGAGRSAPPPNRFRPSLLAGGLRSDNR